MELSMTVLRCPDQVAPEARTVSGGEFHVGRGPDVDWVLPDPDRLLSKRHFAVAFRGGGWQVADTSTNGTFLNTEADSIGRGTPRSLRDGDRLRLGAYEIEIRLVDQPAQYDSRGASSRGDMGGGFGGGAGGGSGQSPFGDPFSEDLMAPPAPARRPFNEPYSDLGVAPTSAQLPHDFDPLAPDRDEPFGGGFRGPVQSDHSSSMEDAMAPPPISGYSAAHTGGTIPGDDLLPDDWDKDLLEGIAPPSQPSPQAFSPPHPSPAPVPPAAAPRTPPPVSHEPFAEAAPRPASAPPVSAPPVSAPPVSAPVEATPAHPAEPVGGLDPFDDLLGGEPLGNAPVDDHPAPARAILPPPSESFAPAFEPVPPPVAPAGVAPVVRQRTPRAAAPPAPPQVAAPEADPFGEPDLIPAPMPPRTQTPPPFEPAPFEASPAASPFDEPSDLLEPRTMVVPAAALRPAAPPQSAAPQAAPAAPQAQAVPMDDSSALAAFFKGAELSGANPTDPMAMMTGLGQAFRALVAGLRSVLIARATIKSEFRIEQTMIRARGNNPLKFSANDDDALTALLGVGRRTDMAPAAAIEDSLRDLRLHELATMAAMQVAVRAMLDELSPDKIRAGSDQGGLAVLPAQRKARAWDAFETRHATIVQALVDDFDSIFGKSFARAYERALDEISTRERQ